MPWRLLQRTSSHLQTFISAVFRRSVSMTSKAKHAMCEQSFHFFLVLDFEATCDDKKRLQPQEIIEWPVLKINSQTWEIESVFHRYIQPRFHPHITGFCTQLTGIIQDMVDEQPYFEDVMQDFEKWMAEEGLLATDKKFAFVTCGDWDLKQMMPSQCRCVDMEVPDFMRQWINIKKPFSQVTAVWGKGMMSMLQHLNIPHEGRHHSGIDDCQNIAKILKRLAEEGHIFSITGQLAK